MQTVDAYNMFCLPPTGSSSAIYMPWRRAVDTLSKTHINIIPIEYSGHGIKPNEPLSDDPKLRQASR